MRVYWDTVLESGEDAGDQGEGASSLSRVLVKRARRAGVYPNIAPLCAGYRNNDRFKDEGK